MIVSKSVRALDQDVLQRLQAAGRGLVLVVKGLYHNVFDPEVLELLDLALDVLVPGSDAVVQKLVLKPSLATYSVASALFSATHMSMPNGISVVSTVKVDVDLRFFGRVGHHGDHGRNSGGFGKFFLGLDQLGCLCAVEVALPVRQNPVLVVEHGRDQQRRVLTRLSADLDAVEGEDFLFLLKRNIMIPFSEI